MKDYVLGAFDQFGDYNCPDGYSHVVLEGGHHACLPTEEVNGVGWEEMLPEVVITASPLLPKKPNKYLVWLKANWYWIVLPTVVAMAWWAWKEYKSRPKSH